MFRNGYPAATQANICGQEGLGSEQEGLGSERVRASGATISDPRSNRLAAPAREEAEQRQDDDDDDDPHDDAEDAPPFYDRQSFRPFRPSNLRVFVTAG